jgi:GMP synthase PP-ATPase subunit
MGEELEELAKKAEAILLEELKKHNIDYSKAEARVYDAKTVGVQGDSKTYAYPAEIKIIKPLYKNGNSLSKEELYDFLRKISNRITNENKEFNRVVYFLEEK